MDSLLNLPAITSHHDLKGLRHLYDSVEAHVRGLRAVGVTSDSYGGLLTSIVMNKLPSEIRLIISRELTEEKWDVEKLMRVIDREVDARERSATSRGSVTAPAFKKPLPRPPPTAAALMTSNSGSVRCAFCEQGHASSACTVIVDNSARKKALRRAGRCYVCLRKGHVSRYCRSTGNCSKCHGRHHTTICPRDSEGASNSSIASACRMARSDSVNQASEGGHTTNVTYIDSQTPILLQTAKLRLYNPSNPGVLSNCVEARAIMDSGSQRTYVTSRLRERLRLTTERTESLHIKTFGSTEGHNATCEAVHLGLLMKSGETLEMTAQVVPFICNPLTSQPINHARDHYDHLLEIDMQTLPTLEMFLKLIC